VSDEHENGNSAGAGNLPFADLTPEAKLRRNNSRLAALQSRGIRLDPSQLRIGTMLELLLGDRMPEAEEEIQNRLDVLLTDVEAKAEEANQAELARIGQQLLQEGKAG